MASPVIAVPRERRNGMPQVVMILGLTAAAVIMVLADVPLWTVMTVISGTTFTGVIGYRILTCGPLPRYVRAPADALLPPGIRISDGLSSSRADVVQLVRPAEGGGDAAS